MKKDEKHKSCSNHRFLLLQRLSILHRRQHTTMAHQQLNTLLILFLSFTTLSYAVVPCVYVVAHQDDWILFMEDLIWLDLAGGNPVTIIHTTAGDANMGETYWRNRETGAVAAIKKMVEYYDPTVAASCNLAISTRDFSSITPSVTGIPIPNQNVGYYSCGTVASYFLRVHSRSGATQTTITPSTTYPQPILFWILQHPELRIETMDA